MRVFLRRLHCLYGSGYRTPCALLAVGIDDHAGAQAAGADVHGQPLREGVVILSDLKMPNMSGFEFLSVVRRRFPQIPTIAISGEFQPAVESLGGVLADAFFVKPFRFEELLAKITELLRDAPPRPATKRDRSPVWVPRNGEYYVITCTDCLRSFSIPAEKSVRVLRELRTLECIFCNAPVQIIVEETQKPPTACPAGCNRFRIAAPR